MILIHFHHCYFQYQSIIFFEYPKNKTWISLLSSFSSSSSRHIDDSIFFQSSFLFFFFVSSISRLDDSFLQYDIDVVDRFNHYHHTFYLTCFLFSRRSNKKRIFYTLRSISSSTMTRDACVYIHTCIYTSRKTSSNDWSRISLHLDYRFK